MNYETKLNFYIKKPPAFADGKFGKRQRPILPVCHHTSTIGPEELNFCVRDENRWTSSALSPLWYNNTIISWNYHMFILTNLTQFVKYFRTLATAYYFRVIAKVCKIAIYQGIYDIVFTKL